MKKSNAKELHIKQDEHAKTDDDLLYATTVAKKEKQERNRDNEATEELLSRYERLRRLYLQLIREENKHKSALDKLEQDKNVMLAKGKNIRGKTSSILKCQKKHNKALSRNKKGSCDLARDLTLLGCEWEERGKFAEAANCYKIAKIVFAKFCGKKSQQVAEALHDIATVYSKQLRFDEALECYNEALEIKEQVFGKESPKVALTYIGIANAYINQSRFAYALKFYETARRIYAQNYEENPSELAKAFLGIANVYQEQSRFAEALNFYKKALVIYRKVFGEKNLDAASVLYSIAIVYRHQSRFDEALECYNEALEIRIEALKSLDVADTLNGIANVYLEQSRFDKALECYNKALEIRIEAKSPHDAAMRNNIAAVYYRQSRFNEALKLYEKALEIYQQVFGEKSSNVAATLNNIANVYNAQSRFDEALKLYNEALEIYKQVFGESSPGVANTLHNIANEYLKQSRFDKALECYNKALEIYKQVFGEKSSNVADSLNGIANVYKEQSRFDEAIKFYEESLEIYKQVFGEKSSNVADILNNIAAVYYRQSRFNEALKLHEEALELKSEVYEIYKKYFPETSYKVCFAGRNLADAYLLVANNSNDLPEQEKREHYIKAIKYLLRVLDADKEILKERFGNFEETDWHGHYQLLGQLSECYQLTHEPIKAADLYFERASFCKDKWPTVALDFLEEALRYYSLCQDAQQRIVDCYLLQADIACDQQRYTYAHRCVQITLHCQDKPDTRARLIAIEKKITACGMDDDLYKQWQYCLDSLHHLRHQLLKELSKEKTELSEHSKNRATELIIKLRGLLDQTFGRFVRESIFDPNNAKEKDIYFAYGSSKLSYQKALKDRGILFNPVLKDGDLSLSKISSSFILSALKDADYLDGKPFVLTEKWYNAKSLADLPCELEPYENYIIERLKQANIGEKITTDFIERTREENSELQKLSQTIIPKWLSLLRNKHYIDTDDCLTDSYTKDAELKNIDIPLDLQSTLSQVVALLKAKRLETNTPEVNKNLENYLKVLTLWNLMGEKKYLNVRAKKLTEKYCLDDKLSEIDIMTVLIKLQGETFADINKGNIRKAIKAALKTKLEKLNLWKYVVEAGYINSTRTLQKKLPIESFVAPDLLKKAKDTLLKELRCLRRAQINKSTFVILENELKQHQGLNLVRMPTGKECITVLLKACYIEPDKKNDGCYSLTEKFKPGCDKLSDVPVGYQRLLAKKLNDFLTKDKKISLDENFPDLYKDILLEQPFNYCNEDRNDKSPDTWKLSWLDKITDIGNDSKHVRLTPQSMKRAAELQVGTFSKESVDIRIEYVAPFIYAWSFMGVILFNESSTKRLGISRTILKCLREANHIDNKRPNPRQPHIRAYLAAYRQEPTSKHVYDCKDAYKEELQKLLQTKFSKEEMEQIYFTGLAEYLLNFALRQRGLDIRPDMTESLHSLLDRAVERTTDMVRKISSNRRSKCIPSLPKGINFALKPIDETIDLNGHLDALLLRLRVTLTGNELDNPTLGGLHKAHIIMEDVERHCCLLGRFKEAAEYSVKMATRIEKFMPRLSMLYLERAIACAGNDVSLKSYRASLQKDLAEKHRKTGLLHLACTHSKKALALSKKTDEGYEKYNKICDQDKKNYDEAKAGIDKDIYSQWEYVQKQYQNLREDLFHHSLQPDDECLKNGIQNLLVDLLIKLRHLFDQNLSRVATKTVYVPQAESQAKCYNLLTGDISQKDEWQEVKKEKLSDEKDKLLLYFCAEGKCWYFHGYNKEKEAVDGVIDELKGFKELVAKLDGKKKTSDITADEKPVLIEVALACMGVDSLGGTIHFPVVRSKNKLKEWFMKNGLEVMEKDLWSNVYRVIKSTQLFYYHDAENNKKQPGLSERSWLGQLVGLTNEAKHVHLRDLCRVDEENAKTKTGKDIEKSFVIDFREQRFWPWSFMNCLDEAKDSEDKLNLSSLLFEACRKKDIIGPRGETLLHDKKGIKKQEALFGQPEFRNIKDKLSDAEKNAVFVSLQNTEHEEILELVPFLDEVFSKLEELMNTCFATIADYEKKFPIEKDDLPDIPALSTTPTIKEPPIKEGKQELDEDDNNSTTAKALSSMGIFKSSPAPQEPAEPTELSMLLDKAVVL